MNTAIAERGDVNEGAKPDYIDLDKDGDKKEPMKKAAKDAKKKKKKTDEGKDIIENYFVHAAKLFEGEEDKAEIVKTQKDMVYQSYRLDGRHSRNAS